jgi:hypothetical protein
MLLLLPIVLLLPPAHAQLVTGVDETAQLPYWELQDKAIKIRLVQRLPDQTRAYFAGRGFNNEDVRLIAEHCVFQTVFTNTAPAGSQQVIEYDASKWRISYKDSLQSLVLREDWDKIWQQRETKQAQKIAFEWSLLPTRQRYQAGDYNWGMTVYKIPHGASFSLKLSWTLNGKPHQASIDNIECAKDVYIPPSTGQ